MSRAPTRAGPAALVGLLAALSGLAVFAVAAVLVARRPGSFAVDAAVLGWVARERSPAVAAAFEVLTHFGDVLGWAPIALVIGALLARRAGTATPVLLVVVTAVGSATLLTVTKLLVQRPRPDGALAVVDESNSGFPSAHAANSAAVYLLLAVLTAGLVRARALRVGTWTAAVLVVVAVGTSRVVLGVHSPTDVLGGWLLGLSWLGVVLAVVSRPSRRATAPAAPPGAPPGSAAPRPPDAPRS